MSRTLLLCKMEEVKARLVALEEARGEAELVGTTLEVRFSHKSLVLHVPWAHLQTHEL